MCEQWAYARATLFTFQRARGVPGHREIVKGRGFDRVRPSCRRGRGVLWRGGDGCERRPSSLPRGLTLVTWACTTEHATVRFVGKCWSANAVVRLVAADDGFRCGVAVDGMPSNVRGCRADEYRIARSPVSQLPVSRRSRPSGYGRHACSASAAKEDSNGLRGAG